MTKEFAPNLERCKTVAQLSTALGADAALLQLLAGDQALTCYRRHDIPKRGRLRLGEFRVVYEPVSEELKHVHKTVARRLSLHASAIDPSFPHECSYGYVRHKSTKDNAEKHCGAHLLLNADIKDFFPSITRARVEAILLRLQLHADNAALLARMFCVDGSLTQGLSASPVIANLACHELDKRLNTLAAAYDATYTRYADDISISGPRVPSKAEIVNLVEMEGFSLSTAKFRITKHGQAQFVTGLSISDARPHVPKRVKRKLRQEMYYCNKLGIEKHLENIDQSSRHGLNRIDGMVKYVSFIERKTRYDFRSQWQSLLDRDDQTPTYFARHSRSTEPQFVAIDESVFEIGGTRYLAQAWTLFADQNRMETAVSSVLEKYLADPYSAGKKGDIRKEGLHFAAAHAQLRNDFVQVLPMLPFRCYTVLTRLHADTDYLATYLHQLRWTFSLIAMRCDRQNLTMYIEQNPRVSAQLMQKDISEGYDLMTKAGFRRPLVEPTISMLSKQSPLVSLPDFMLGVLAKYLTSSGEDGSVAISQFERLRDRYSLIFDLDNSKPYSRRKPISRDSLSGTTSA